MSAAGKADGYAAAVGDGHAAVTVRPNIVVVLTDDQGPWAMPDLTPELRMPQLGAMIAESLSFDRAYCASPVCSPARASILTGRTPSAHGIHDYLVGRQHPDAYPDLYLGGQPTTPEVLARNGYQCAHSGKWHVGEARLPAAGFEWWYAHRFGGGPYYDAPIWRDGVEAVQPGYLSDAITAEAIAFLEARDQDRPFYLQVHYTAPHTPWIDSHPADLVALYDGCDFPSVPREPRHPWTLPRQRAFAAAVADPLPHLVGYFAALSGVDRGLGAIRGALQRGGVADSTIVVYLSDNGFSCGHHGLWGKGNGTFPLNFWDNSVRVPLVVHAPGGVSGRTERLTSTRELHETLCELAGVRPDPDRWRAPGSFASTLYGRDTTADDQEFAVVTAEYGQGRMITDGRWVRVLRSSGPDELYDHASDPGELVNLSDDPAYAEEQERLDAGLRSWFARFASADLDAYHRPISGRGQIHPVARGRSPEDTYVGDDAPPAAT